MADQENTANYPDILGAITRGARLNMDVVQCAVAARPPRVPAGQAVEFVLLLQNASDIDVDIVIETELPKRDQAKQKDRFVTKSPKLLIGLRPAEAGFAVLPVAIAPNTKPAEGYEVVMALKIKRMSRKLQRIRKAEGGGRFDPSKLSEEVQTHMRELHALPFSIQSPKKNRLQIPFTVLPPAASGQMRLQANYVTLWSMADYEDDQMLAQQVWEPAQQVVGQMKRDKIFMPLLKTTQEHFADCGYPLLPPEAIYITKLVTLVAETGIETPTPQNPHPSWPLWFNRLVRLLAKEPTLAERIETLVTQQMYPDLLYDSIMQGFAMLANVTNEDFGTQDEMSDYAKTLLAALHDGEQFYFSRAYLPLVLGGLIANTRVTMPREQVRETVFILSKALEKRQPERDDANGFVFDMAATLIERALDML